MYSSDSDVGSQTGCYGSIDYVRTDLIKYVRVARYMLQRFGMLSILTYAQSIMPTEHEREGKGPLSMLADRFFGSML